MNNLWSLVFFAYGPTNLHCGQNKFSNNKDNADLLKFDTSSFRWFSLQNIWQMRQFLGSFQDILSSILAHF